MAATMDLHDFLTVCRFDLNMSTAADEEKEASSALKLPRYNYGIIMTCDFPDENKLVPDMIVAEVVAQMVEHFKGSKVISHNLLFASSSMKS